MGDDAATLLFAAGTNYDGQCMADPDPSWPDRAVLAANAGAVSSVEGEPLPHERATDPNGFPVFRLIPLEAKVISVACGDAHTLVATADGRCLASGQNRSGQLGITTIPAPIFVLTHVQQLSGVRITHVSAGAHHSAAVSDNGRLYMWGSNRHAALGLGKVGGLCFHPQRVKRLENERIVEVGCGFGHTVARTSSGDLYAFGFNAWGQCGVQPTTSAPHVVNPRLVSELRDRIVRVACGRHHTIAIDKEGGVFAWGGAAGGRLGVDSVASSVSTPMRVQVPNGQRALSAGCGWFHSAILLASGEVVTTGDGSEGQLSFEIEDFQRFPEPIHDFESTALMVAAGSQHTAVVTTARKLVMFGSGSALGVNRGECIVHRPASVFAGMDASGTRVVPFGKVLAVACGGSHTVVVASGVD